MDNRDDTLEQLVRDIFSISTDGDDRGEVESVKWKNIQREKSWTKGLLAFQTDRAAAECVARVYFDMAQTHPDASVILPTGRSATMIFRAMTKIADEYDECPFGEVHIISDTETFGVWSEHETSRSKHIKDMLLTPLKRKNRGSTGGAGSFIVWCVYRCRSYQKCAKVIGYIPPAVHAVSLSPLGEILAYEVRNI